MAEENTNHQEAIKVCPNPIRAIWKADPKRPIFSALLEAELQRLDILFDVSFPDINTVKTLEDAIALMKKGRILGEEGAEILDWIFPQRSSTLGSALKMATTLKDQNVSEEIWSAFIKNAGKKQQGRPITKRQIAITALEKQIREPNRNWSYRELAQKFCNCGKTQHDENCAQNLRQTMIQLKKLLKKYCPNFTL